jgi:hypothetical protein
MREFRSDRFCSLQEPPDESIVACVASVARAGSQRSGDTPRVLAATVQQRPSTLAGEEFAQPPAPIRTWRCAHGGVDGWVDERASRLTRPAPRLFGFGKFRGSR